MNRHADRDARTIRRRGRQAARGGTLSGRLVGSLLPAVELQYSPGEWTNLAVLARRWTLVVFFFAGTEQDPADASQEMGRDERRAFEWSRCDSELHALGCEIIGISAQTLIEQARFAGRDPIPYLLLSDPDLDLAAQLDLPTVEHDGAPVYEPLTLIIHEQKIAQVFHPIDPTNEATQATRWITSETHR
jgi:peroxiredoxin